jgi:hypothetical protein
VPASLAHFSRAPARLLIDVASLAVRAFRHARSLARNVATSENLFRQGARTSGARRDEFHRLTGP